MYLCMYDCMYVCMYVRVFVGSNVTSLYIYMVDYVNGCSSIKEKELQFSTERINSLCQLGDSRVLLQKGSSPYLDMRQKGDTTG